MASRTTLTWLALWYCTPFSQLTPVHKARPLALAPSSIQLFDTASYESGLSYHSHLLALWYCTPFSQLKVHKPGLWRWRHQAVRSNYLTTASYESGLSYTLTGSLFGTALRFHSLNLSIKPGLWRWRHQAVRIQLFDHRKLREWPLVPLSLGSLFGIALRFHSLHLSIKPGLWRWRHQAGRIQLFDHASYESGLSYHSHLARSLVLHSVFTAYTCP